MPEVSAPGRSGWWRCIWMGCSGENTGSLSRQFRSELGLGGAEVAQEGRRREASGRGRGDNPVLSRILFVEEGGHLFLFPLGWEVRRGRGENPVYRESSMSKRVAPVPPGHLSGGVPV